MKDKKWILFSALKYLNSKTSLGRYIIVVISIIMLSFGVSALIFILGIMNGLQKGYIDNILEISSAHIRIDVDGNFDETIMDKFKKIDNINSIVLAKDLQVVLSVDGAMKSGYILRALDEASIETDKNFKERLTIIRGEFDISDDAVIVSRNFSLNNGAHIGSNLELIILSDKNLNIIKPKIKRFKVTGIYDTGFSDIDSVYLFANINFFESDISDNTYYFKLKNRYNDLVVKSEIEQILKSESKNFSIQSWRDFNKSFFSALIIEKVSMSLLLSLVVIIVALNIYYMFKRLVYEKREDIAILLALGANSIDIKQIYLFLGFFIGFIGSTIGLFSGLLISKNFNSIIIFLDNFLLTVFSNFNIYFDLSFYHNLPVILIFKEIFFIYLFGISSTVISAYFSSKKLSKIKPCEVLRYE